MLQALQKIKEDLEKQIVQLYILRSNAGVATVGDFTIRIWLLEQQVKDIDGKISYEVKGTTVESQTVDENIRKIKLFLASSFELKEERDQLEIFIGRENKNFIDKKIFFKLTIWEDFLDAMSVTRLQDEYNKAIKESDIFISLFATKTGKYTEEEFDAALQQFKATGKPLVYTYFRNDISFSQNSTPESESLMKFKQKLANLGHFYTSFSNVYDLKFQIKTQLEKALPII